MALVQHLEELRLRLLFCVAAVIVGTAVAVVFYDAILARLLRPLPRAQAGALEAIGGGHRIAVTGVGEAAVATYQPFWAVRANPLRQLSWKRWRERPGATSRHRQERT